MWIIEKSGDWSRWIRILASNRFSVKRISPGQNTPSGKTQPWGIAVEFEADCLDSWLALFDKTGWKLENSVNVLLGAPLDPTQLSWCREFGFTELIRDIPSLEQALNRSWHSLNRQPAADCFRDEMLQRIPWNETV